MKVKFYLDHGPGFEKIYNVDFLPRIGDGVNFCNEETDFVYCGNVKWINHIIKDNGIDIVIVIDKDKDIDEEMIIRDGWKTP